MAENYPAYKARGMALVYVCVSKLFIGYVVVAYEFECVGACCCEERKDHCSTECPNSCQKGGVDQALGRTGGEEEREATRQPLERCVKEGGGGDGGGGEGVGKEHPCIVSSFPHHPMFVDLHLDSET